MSKALRFSIAVVVAEASIVLGTVIPRKLEEAFPVRSVVGSRLVWNRVCGGISQEVVGKLGGVILIRADQCHAHDVLVEVKRLFGVLASYHGVVLAFNSQCR